MGMKDVFFFDIARVSVGAPSVGWGIEINCWEFNVGNKEDSVSFSFLMGKLDRTRYDSPLSASAPEGAFFLVMALLRPVLRPVL